MIYRKGYLKKFVIPKDKDRFEYPNLKLSCITRVFDKETGEELLFSVDNEMYEMLSDSEQDKVKSDCIYWNGEQVFLGYFFCIDYDKEEGFRVSPNTYAEKIYKDFPYRVELEINCGYLNDVTDVDRVSVDEIRRRLIENKEIYDITDNFVGNLDIINRMRV